MINIPGLNTYFGGKGRDGVYQNIINLQPKHEMYIEPFLGSGAIMRRKAPAKINIGFEINPKIYSLWLKAMGKQPIANPEKYQSADGQIDSLVLTVIYADALTWFESLWDRNVFNRIKAEDILFYMDPPYPPETRTSKGKYTFDFVNDHERLLQYIQKTKFKIQISSYDNELYNNYLKNWNRHEFITYDHAHKPRTEVIYYNYPPPTELHTWNYTGSDYRQRENIKRKVKRFVAKFQNMPVLERNAILEEITKI